MHICGIMASHQAMVTSMKSQHHVGSERYYAGAAEFIPYACHYDKNTLLTKNGELVQTIKISGFTFEVEGKDPPDLRKALRQAIAKHVHPNEQAIWFHTIRSRRNLVPGGTFVAKFARDIKDAWSHKNYWHDKFVSELYVTLVSNPKDIKTWNISTLAGAMYFKVLESAHRKFLEHAHAALSRVVENIMQDLLTFNPHLLSIVVREEGVFSENLAFINKILYIKDEEIPLPIVDLSNYLSSRAISFGNVAIEIRQENHKSFAAMLSIKEFHDMGGDYLKRLLELPVQMAICQTVDFIPSKKARAAFEHANYILTLSGDEKLRQISGIAEIMNEEGLTAYDFAESQMSLMVAAATRNKLAEDIHRVSEALIELGLVIVREDMNLEGCYWSQLPANFSFITRKSIVHKTAIAGFAGINNTPTGKLHSKWGEAITLFRTFHGTPYFFNFHDGDNGNTLVIGEPHRGIRALVHFLISQTTKYTSSVYMVDCTGYGTAFVEAMGGLSLVMSTNVTEASHALNPLCLEDNSGNRTFLAGWLTCLAGIQAGQCSLEIEQVLTQAVAYIMGCAPENRRLNVLTEWVAAQGEVGASTAAVLAEWHGEGQYAALFDYEQDAFPSHRRFLSLDVMPIIDESPQVLAAVFSYYLHRIEQQLDGTPALIAMDKFHEIARNVYMVQDLTRWIGGVNAKDAILLMTMRELTMDFPEALVDFFQTQIATLIQFPDGSSLEQYKELFGFADAQLIKLKQSQLLNRMFLITQGENATAIELNLSGMKHILPVLEGGADTYDVMLREVAMSGSNDPAQWLPRFYAHYGYNE
jgi:type IV secretion system protein VirB4